MKFNSKKDQIYIYLREQIMTGAIAPGERLVIDKLAEELNTSQTPLREVLRMLQSDGLVEIEPYVGARVAPLEADSIYEIFSLLSSLEISSSKLACHRMSDEELDELAQRVDAMAALTDKPDAWSQENKALHAFICECATMPLMRRMLLTVLDHWDRLRRIYLNDVSSKRVTAAQQEHVDLLAALRARDPERVEQILRRHNEASLNAYLTLLQESGALEKVL